MMPFPEIGNFKTGETTTDMYIRSSQTEESKSNVFPVLMIYIRFDGVSSESILIILIICSYLLLSLTSE